MQVFRQAYRMQKRGEVFVQSWDDPLRSVAPSLAPTRSRSLAPTRLRSLAPTYSVTCTHIRPTTGERGGGRRGGEVAGGGMTTTLFHAGSTTVTTTSSHPRGQHDQSPASQRVRGGEGGYDNDLVSRGQHDHIQSRPHPVEFRHSLL